jgi:hypothetical protein
MENLLADEKESIERDLLRVTEMLPKLKTQIFRCSGNQFLDSETKQKLDSLYSVLSNYQLFFYEKENELKS